jgi:tetratricopeptide (TPR) repeat protein
MSTLCHPADLAVAGDVLREADPDPQRVLLWLRGDGDDQRRAWQRVSGHLLARVELPDGVHIVPVRVASFRQEARTDFRRVFDRFWSGQRQQAGRYVLPTGDWVEADGPSRGDALLAWSAAPEAAFDAGRVAALWPGNQGCRQLGPNLVLVVGVEPPAAPPRAAAPQAAPAPPPAPAPSLPRENGTTAAADGRLPDAALQRQLEERSRHVRDLSRRGLHQQALQEAGELLDWARAQRGPAHPWVATCLLLIARIHHVRGDEAAAEPLYREALGISCPVLGDNHPNFTTGLNNLAVLYQSRGDYADAEPLHRQALQVRGAALQEMHPLVATSLNNLGLLYHACGDTTTAEPLLLRALEIFKATLGEAHPDTATCLDNLAAFYEGLGDAAAGSTLAEEARQVRRAAEGKDHVLVADTLNMLVALPRPSAPTPAPAAEVPVPAPAEPAPPEEAGALPWLAAPGPADSFWEQDQAKAESPAAALGDEPAAPTAPPEPSPEAPAVTAAGLEPDAAASTMATVPAFLPPDAAHVGTASGGGYVPPEPDEGPVDDPTAEPLLPDEPLPAEAAEGPPAGGEPWGAEPAPEAADLPGARPEEAGPPATPELDDAAPVSRVEAPDLPAPTDLSEPALLIDETAADTGPGGRAEEPAGLGEVGLLLDEEIIPEKMTVADAADPALSAEQEPPPEAVGSPAAADERVADPEAPGADAAPPAEPWHVAEPVGDSTALDLGATAATVADVPAPERTDVQPPAPTEGMIVLLQGPDSGVVPPNVVDDLPRVVPAAAPAPEALPSDVPVSAALLEAGGETCWSAGDYKAAERLYRQALERHDAGLEGADGDASTALRGLILTCAATGRLAEAAGLLQRLLAPDRPRPADPFQDPESLELFLSLVLQHAAGVPEVVRSGLDFVLRHRAARFAAGEAPDAGPDEVARSLPADSALVEFVCSRPPGSAARYLAFVLPAGDAARATLHDLGEAAALDRLSAAFRAWITGEQDGERVAPVWRPPAARGAALAAGATLRAALFDPLTGALGGRTRLLLAPAGNLACLPVEVLPGADGRPLLETHQISYVDSGLDVLYFGVQPEEQPGPSVVAADPDFDLYLAALPPGAPGCRLAPGPDASGRFERLSATRRGAKRFAALLGVEVWLAGAARKPALQAVRSPRVLHLATHCVCGGDVPGGAVLALAGANGYGPGSRPPAGADDGLLTAAEIAGLDLRATELVVLSACDTGPSAAPAGDGVRALGRAFLQAGAAAVVLSLWKVTDWHVKELLSDFYERVLAGAPRAEALRQAQLTLRARFPDRPEYWGAFVCHGDPGPLRPLPGGRKKGKAGLLGALRGTR